MARLGLPVFGFYAASVLLRSADRLALVRFGDAATLGVYGLGVIAAGLVLYLPEAAAAVLYPRLAAAAGGAGDRAATLQQTARAQRAIAVALPVGVALAIVWADPVVARVLPAYRAGVPALRLLVIGGLLLSPGTLPAYALLAHGGAVRLVRLTAVAAAIELALAFGVAARAPRPTPVAVAACAGYAMFSLVLVSSAAGLLQPSATRAAFIGASFAPAVWAAALALLACALGGEGLLAAATRSVAVLAAYAPVGWWFGRGLGFRQLARAWLPQPAVHHA